ncbi:MULTISPECIES: NAD kinase [unclassified Terrabacter]|uniref:NAD kinase n=1 Tax=unclassified Terrabacter TaxID=2630222 RepID=UPI0006F3CE06|nr:MULTISPECIES: NAD kinase [unclassified Terrabacter]KRB45727.1 NAD kinase [Terrabacter sp. Root181]KRF41575.1 NAD kinase [Terrabacter sp. Soil810]
MTRRILLVAHPRRPEALTVAKGVVERLTHLGIDVSLQADEAEALDLKDSARVHIASAEEQVAEGCDLVVVLGGDGTILRGAEFARSVDVPLLGVNLGHVGFLAEAERDDLDATVEHIASNDYAVEERMTLHVDAKLHGDLIASSWALNEVSVEKAARERMLEVTVEVDGRPLSSWGCDGVIVSTPTGSTAYAFSAGGPVVWPQVEAMLLVPSAAHALFARPLVLGPDTHLAVEIKAATEGAGVMWCDGRRHVDLPPGARIEVRRGLRPLRLARLTSAPFTDRLVAKFNLSVAGWRGNGNGDTTTPVDDVDGGAGARP